MIVDSGVIVAWWRILSHNKNVLFVDGFVILILCNFPCSTRQQEATARNAIDMPNETLGRRREEEEEGERDKLMLIEEE